MTSFSSTPTTRPPPLLPLLNHIDRTPADQSTFEQEVAMCLDYWKERQATWRNHASAAATAPPSAFENVQNLQDTKQLLSAAAQAQAQQQTDVMPALIAPPMPPRIPVNTLVQLNGVKKQQFNGAFGHVIEPDVDHPPNDDTLFVLLRHGQPNVQEDINTLIKVDPQLVVPYIGDAARFMEQKFIIAAERALVTAVSKLSKTAPAAPQPQPPLPPIKDPPNKSSSRINVHVNPESTVLGSWTHLSNKIHDINVPSPAVSESWSVVKLALLSAINDCAMMSTAIVSPLRELVETVTKYKTRTSKDKILDEAITSNMRTLMEKLTYPRTQYDATMKKLGEMHDAIESVAISDITMQNSISERSESVADLTGQCTQLEADVAALKVDYEQSKRDIKKKEREKEKMMARNKSKLKEMADMNTVLESLEQKIATASAATSVLVSETMPGIEARRDARARAITELEQTHKSLSRQIQLQRNAITAGKTENDTKTGMIKKLEVEFTQTKLVTEKERQNRDAILQDVKMKQAKLSELRARNAALEKQIKDMSSANGGGGPHTVLPKTQDHETDSECLVCYNEVDEELDLTIDGVKVRRAMVAMAPCTCWKFCDQCIFTYAPGTLQVTGINLKVLTNAKGTDLFRCPSCQQSVTRIICDRGFHADVHVVVGGKLHKRNGWDVTFRDGRKPIFVPTPRELAEV